jgi:hypothetical protein
MSSTASLEQEIAQQTTLFNELRLKNAEASVQDEAKKKLGELKKSLALSKGGGGSKDAGKKRERLMLKTAKVRIPLGQHRRDLTYSTRLAGYTGLRPRRDVLSRTR